MSLDQARIAFGDAHPPGGFGMAAEHEARLAARRTFVEMKLAFMKVAAELSGSRGLLLQRQVRQANEPAELLVLHKDLVDALPRETSRARQLRNELSSQLDRLFPETEPLGKLGLLV